MPWFANLRVVLVRTRNPLNIGAAARAMSNFGFLRLRLVSPWEPSFVQARSAVGAAELLQNAELFHSVADAVADCSLVLGTTAVGERELQHPLRPLREGSSQMRAAMQAAPVALLFGSEKTGLSNEEMSHCQALLRIPTRDAHISMNLGQAVAICLYELTSGDATTGALPMATEPLTALSGDVERLTQLLMETLQRIEYLPPLAESSALEKLRRAMLRLRLSADDARLWLGILRRIQWRLDEADRKSR